MQTDPVGYEDQVNLYSYVGLDPVNKADPLGLAGEDDELEKFRKTIQDAAKSAKDEVQEALSGAKNELSKARDDLSKAARDLQGAVTEDLPDAAATASDALGLTEHAAARREQARAGDASRDVGDPNRVIREGRTFKDTVTGYTVYVSGNKAVIVDSATGEQVTQMKITRENLQSRIRRGRWEPN